MTSTHYQHIIDFLASTGVPYRVTSTVRPAPSGYHGLGLAVDFGQVDGIDTFSAEGLAQMLAIFEAFAAHSSLLAELIHNQPATSGRTVKNGQLVPDMFWGADTWAAHTNHVHVAIEESTWLPIKEADMDFTLYDEATGGSWICAAENGAVYAANGAPTLGGLTDHPDWDPPGVPFQACGFSPFHDLRGLGYTIWVKFPDGSRRAYTFARTPS